MAADRTTFGQAGSRFGRRPTAGEPTAGPPSLRPTVPVAPASAPVPPVNNSLLGASIMARHPAATASESSGTPTLDLPAVPDAEAFAIHGGDMQFVEVGLARGETVVAEAGCLMFKDAAVTMETLMGDGTSSGVFDKLAGAGKRMLAGENLFMTHFTNQGAGKAKVAFAAAYPGKIVPMRLADHGGSLICQRDTFLCGIRGVSIGIAFQKKIMSGLFGGNGFIMQKLEGQGLVFLHSGGTLAERTLAPGERVHVDAGCVVAYETSVSFDVARVGGIKSMLLGDEGFFFAELTGPGRIWMQSLPFSRLAARMMAGAKVSPGRGPSVLGSRFAGSGGRSRGDDEAQEDESPYRVSESDQLDADAGSDDDGEAKSSSLLGSVTSLFGGE